MAIMAVAVAVAGSTKTILETVVLVALVAVAPVALVALAMETAPLVAVSASAAAMAVPASLVAVGRFILGTVDTAAGVRLGWQVPPATSVLLVVLAASAYPAAVVTAAVVAAVAAARVVWVHMPALVGKGEQVALADTAVLVRVGAS